VSKTASISRKLAWRALVEYQKTSRDPAEILRSLLTNEIPKKELDLAWEITFGAIRYMKRLDYIAGIYIDAPLDKQKPGIIAALRIGLYQLTQTDAIPEYAAVNETVTLIRDSLSKKEAGFINAILRAYIREPEKVRFPHNHYSIRIRNGL
jgi:16S rRNA (cytosine967-C5)-methyltransferase